MSMTDISIEHGAIRKPRVADVQAIRSLIEVEAGQGNMLPRTPNEICENIRDFHTYTDEQGVGGCCALHVDMPRLAEIRSLVVRRDLRSRGIGYKLVEACLREARELGIPQVYALTLVPEFFAKLGFRTIDKNDLPHKVFRDCVRCPSFPDCHEVAVLCDVDSCH